MFYRFLADLVVLLHALFVLFAVLGGFLVLWKAHIAWFHIPAVFWAAGIEFLGWVCPLTPLENILRTMGGAAGYETGFVEHFLLPILYPASLTRQLQIGLGLVVICVNIGIYISVWGRMRKTGKKKE